MSLIWSLTTIWLYNDFLIVKEFNYEKSQFDERLLLNIISEKVRHAIQHMKSYSLLVKQE